MRITFVIFFIKARTRLAPYKSVVGSPTLLLYVPINWREIFRGFSFYVVFYLELRFLENRFGKIGRRDFLWADLVAITDGV